MVYPVGRTAAGLIGYSTVPPIVEPVFCCTINKPVSICSAVLPGAVTHSCISLESIMGKLKSHSLFSPLLEYMCFVFCIEIVMTIAPSYCSLLNTSLHLL